MILTRGSGVSLRFDRNSPQVENPTQTLADYCLRLSVVLCGYPKVSQAHPMIAYLAVLNTRDEM